MSNNFDTDIIIDDGVGTAAAPASYLGFGRVAGGNVSTGPRVYTGTGSPNGVVTGAPVGSIWVRSDVAQLWQFTAAPSTWTQLGSISSGGLSPTGLDTTATADFDWDVADNVATAVSWDAAGAAGILGIDSTDGDECAFVSQGMRILDNAELQFGAAGNDVIITADGTDAVVSGSGALVFDDAFDVIFGAGSDAIFASDGTSLTIDPGGSGIIAFLDGTTLDVEDNAADAFAVAEGSNIYVGVDTTDGAEVLTLGSPGTVELGGVAGSVNAPGVNFGTRLVLEEVFTQRPALNADIGISTNIDFELAGTNAATAASTFASTGGINLATATATNDQMIVRPHQDANQTMWAASIWGSDDEIQFRCNVRGVDATDVRVVCGVKLDPTDLSDSGDADQMIVRFDSSDGVTSGTNWVLVTSNAGNDALEDTGVAYANATNYRIVLNVAPITRQVSCYINGALVNTPANHTLQAATDIGEPCFGIQTLANSAKNTVLQRLGCSKIYG